MKRVNLSNLITQMITEMLEDREYADIKRNELAGTLGCVPSQINYVIASRFTPEQGYLVESRRGGGGYIRIYRRAASMDDEISYIIGTTGNALDATVCRMHIVNLLSRSAVTGNEARLLYSATADSCYKELPQVLRDAVRAQVFKQMLLTVKQLHESQSSGNAKGEAAP